MLLDPDVAVIIPVPLPTEVTSPADETVAMSVSDALHVIVAPEIVDPFTSFTVAVSVAVSANEAKLRLVGDRVTDDATWAIVTEADALAEPDVAVMVAVPFPTAVTKPPAETVAMSVSDELHVTVAPEIVDPPASFTVGVSVAVSAIEVKLRLSGDRVTDDAT